MDQHRTTSNGDFTKIDQPTIGEDFDAGRFTNHSRVVGVRLARPGLSHRHAFREPPSRIGSSQSPEGVKKCPPRARKWLLDSRRLTQCDNHRRATRISEPSAGMKSVDCRFRLLDRILKPRTAVVAIGCLHGSRSVNQQHRPTASPRRRLETGLRNRESNEHERQQLQGQKQIEPEPLEWDVGLDVLSCLHPQTGARNELARSAKPQQVEHEQYWNEGHE